MIKLDKDTVIPSATPVDPLGEQEQEPQEEPNPKSIQDEPGDEKEGVDVPKDG